MYANAVAVASIMAVNGQHNPTHGAYCPAQGEYHEALHLHDSKLSHTERTLPLVLWTASETHTREVRSNPMAKDTRTSNGLRTKRIPGTATQAGRIIDAVRRRRAAGEATVTLSDYQPTEAIWAAIVQQIGMVEAVKLDL
jgi:hypothetical protein